MKGSLAGAQVASHARVRELDLNREPWDKEDLLAQEAMHLILVCASVCLPVARLHVERFLAVLR